MEVVKGVRHLDPAELVERRRQQMKQRATSNDVGQNGIRNLSIDELILRKRARLQAKQG